VEVENTVEEKENLCFVEEAVKDEQVEGQYSVDWDFWLIYDDYLDGEDILKVSYLPHSEDTCNTYQVFDESPKKYLILRKGHLFPLKDEHLTISSYDKKKKINWSYLRSIHWAIFDWISV
jgi:hypothetical protein